ncbi:MAG: bifunctional folylpolyglutamate synthase/dihydrofolate synthase, partial [Paracoccaceae bacterium]
IEGLYAISIPNEINTLPAETTRDAALLVNMKAHAATDVIGALRAIQALNPRARVLICGSLYLAGMILCENG